jgi:hypothetical protein
MRNVTAVFPGMPFLINGYAVIAVNNTLIAVPTTVVKVEFQYAFHIKGE